MLPKKNRLTKTKDFEKIFKQGRSFYTKLLGVKVLANQTGSNRFGIVISSKISKKSTKRNKLKRQLRQALRAANAGLTAGLDLVIIGAPGLLKSDYQTIKSEL